MPDAIHPQTRIGHIHLKVSNLDRALHFYRDILGFEVTQNLGSAAFLSAGGYHHHIGLNTWESLGTGPAPRHAAGLYHAAILYPNRQELAKAFKRLLDHDYPIQGAADHGVSEAIYLSDPDGNGLELYYDRPKDQWPIVNGKLEMISLPLDLDDLLSQASPM